MVVTQQIPPSILQHLAESMPAYVLSVEPMVVRPHADQTLPAYGSGALHLCSVACLSLLRQVEKIDQKVKFIQSMLTAAMGVACNDAGGP